MLDFVRVAVKISAIIAIIAVFALALNFFLNVNIPLDLSPLISGIGSAKAFLSFNFPALLIFLPTIISLYIFYLSLPVLFTIVKSIKNLMKVWE